jgi:hypothetical protein
MYLSVGPLRSARAQAYLLPAQRNRCVPAGRIHRLVADARALSRQPLRLMPAWPQIGCVGCCCAVWEPSAVASPWSRSDAAFLEGQAGPPRINGPRMTGRLRPFLPTQCRSDVWQRRSASTVSVRSSPPMHRHRAVILTRRSGLPSRRRMHYAGEESGCGVAWRNGIDGRAGATRQLGEAARHTARLALNSVSRRPSNTLGCRR